MTLIVILIVIVIVIVVVVVVAVVVVIFVAAVVVVVVVVIVIVSTFDHDDTHLVECIDCRVRWKSSQITMAFTNLGLYEPTPTSTNMLIIWLLGNSIRSRESRPS